MSKIFITGSADGLGLLSSQALAKRGHSVYLHARNPSRANDAQQSCPEAKGVFVADLSSAEETKRLAADLNKSGPWDVVIHNAGIMRGSAGSIFAVNTMAPYLLTCLIDPPPRRYVFLSSGMHFSGDDSLRDLPSSGYGDTKLHNVMLAAWFARRFGEATRCHSMDPGWVPTKMGGRGAPDDINDSIATYVLLAEGSGDAKESSGRYWKRSRVTGPKGSAFDERKQERLVGLLKDLCGVWPPEWM